MTTTSSPGGTRSRRSADGLRAASWRPVSHPGVTAAGTPVGAGTARRGPASGRSAPAVGHCAGMLTLETLPHMIRSGDVHTVVVAFPDLQGRPVGKRVTGCLLPRARRRPRHRGVRLPAGLRRRHGPAAGLRVRQLGDRLRRPQRRHRPPDGPAHPLAPGQRARPVRPADHGRRAGRGLAPAHPAPPDRAGRRAGLRGQVRHRARVLPVPRLVHRGRRQALAEPRPPRHLDRGLPAPPDVARGVHHRPHPQRDDSRRASRSSSPRARPASASTRSTSPTAPPSRWPTATWCSRTA